MGQFFFIKGHNSFADQYIRRKKKKEIHNRAASLMVFRSVCTPWFVILDKPLPLRTKKKKSTKEVTLELPVNNNHLWDNF